MRKKTNYKFFTLLYMLSICLDAVIGQAGFNLGTIFFYLSVIKAQDMMDSYVIFCFEINCDDMYLARKGFGTRC